MTLSLVAESGSGPVIVFLNERAGYEYVWLNAYSAEDIVTFASADVAVVRVEPGGELEKRCRVVAVGIGDTHVVAQAGGVECTIAVSVRDSLQDIGFNWY